ncbi:MAG: hypothetical protein D6780_03450 [Candidatus Dadabacteria bacterium]|nr:MAG: hypothetical protein D6780_03450 [Candidatus Dadabacteria bacterium]
MGAFPSVSRDARIWLAVGAILFFIGIGNLYLGVKKLQYYREASVALNPKSSTLFSKGGVAELLKEESLQIEQVKFHSKMRAIMQFYRFVVFGGEVLIVLGLFPLIFARFLSEKKRV